MKYKDMMLFILLITAFSGIIFGIIVSKNSALNITGIGNEIGVLNDISITFTKVYFQIFLKNVFLLLIIFTLGIFVFGFPLSVILLVYKGYTIGFTCGCICIAVGIKGIASAIVGVLFPSGIILMLFCCMVYALWKYDRKISKRPGMRLRANLKKGIQFAILLIPCTLLQSFMQYIMIYKFL